MPNGVSQQISRITRTALNDINESVPGGQQSVSGANIYAAQLGAREFLDGNTGGVRYDSAVNTLYGGVYQYVQFYNGTTTPAMGSPTSWAYDQNNAAFESYIVTADTNNIIRVGRFAGFALNAVTKGQYGWIQTSGKASGQFITTITKATPADGDLVVIDPTTGLCDVLADTTAITSINLKAAIGTAIGAPVSNKVNLILLRVQNFVV